MFRRSWFLFLATLALGLATLAWHSGAQAANKAGGLQPGTACTLFFRGDAAGQSVQSYLASVNNNANIAGTLVSLDDQWVIIAKDKKHCYIPRNVVLMIQVEAKP